MSTWASVVGEQPELSESTLTVESSKEVITDFNLKYTLPPKKTISKAKFETWLENNQDQVNNLYDFFCGNKYMPPVSFEKFSAFIFNNS